MKKQKIKTFEGACKALKLDAKKVLPKVTSFPKHHQEALTAHAKLVIIVEALNEGWKPNWLDHNQPKFFAWFFHDNKPGSAFSFNGCDYGYNCANAYVGSRLCFKDKETAMYAGKQFEKLYKQYFTL